MPRVLIVDDDWRIREICREVLEPEGYEVGEAPDGVVALKMFEQTPYDVVLCDIYMPNMDGIETIHELVEHYVAVKVVAMSGGAAGLPDYLNSAKVFGAVSVLSKPFSAGQLLDAVAVALDPGAQ